VKQGAIVNLDHARCLAMAATSTRKAVPPPTSWSGGRIGVPT